MNLRKIFIGIALVNLSGFSLHSQVRLNEMQSSNASTVTDNFGEYEDWVEIHNTSGSAIEVGGLVLKDQLDTWMIPTGQPETLIPANGFLMLWADDQEVQGVFHTNFKLSGANGEFLGLYDTDSATIIDSITIPPLGSNQSFIRCVNNSWLVSNLPTYNADNDCTADVEFIKGDKEQDYLEFDYETKSLTVNLDQNESWQIAVYSMSGRVAYNNSLNEVMTKINLSRLEQGTYFAILERKKEFFRLKFVIP